MENIRAFEVCLTKPYEEGYPFRFTITNPREFQTAKRIVVQVINYETAEVKVIEGRVLALDLENHFLFCELKFDLIAYMDSGFQAIHVSRVGFNSHLKRVK